LKLSTIDQAQLLGYRQSRSETAPKAISTGRYPRLAKQTKMKLALPTLTMALLVTVGMAAPIPVPKSVRYRYCLFGFTMLCHVYCTTLRGVN
jgi:hypothetical protein